MPPIVHADGNHVSDAEQQHGSDDAADVLYHEQNGTEGHSTPTLHDFGYHPLSNTRSADSALYDYTADKSLSLADSKLFYQRHRTGQRDTTELNSPLERSLTSLSLGHGSRTTGNLSYAAKQGESGIPPQSTVHPGKDHGIQNHGSYNYNADEKSVRTKIENPTEGHQGTDSESHPKSPFFPNEGDSDRPGTFPTGVQPSYPGSVEVEAGSNSNALSGDNLAVDNELSAIYTNVQRILDTRHKYMRLSLQEAGANPKDDPSWRIFPPPPEPAWREEQQQQQQQQQQAGSQVEAANVLNDRNRANSQGLNQDGSPTQHQPSVRKHRKPGQNVGEDFELSELFPLPEESEMTFKLDESGVFQVYENSKSAEIGVPVLAIPTIRDFYMDLDSILQISSEGPTKSFAFRRLQYLEGKFNLYFLLNEYQEIADSKRVPHRDFYNVRKVDTHVHHSSCMNQKHLLRFIKSKMKKCPTEIVMYRDGKHLSLEEVFESINLTAYDLSIDTLDMHVCARPFHNRCRH